MMFWLPSLLLALQAQVGIPRCPEIVWHEWVSSEHARRIFGDRTSCLLHSASMSAMWVFISAPLRWQLGLLVMSGLW